MAESDFGRTWTYRYLDEHGAVVTLLECGDNQDALHHLERLRAEGDESIVRVERRNMSGHWVAV